MAEVIVVIGKPGLRAGKTYKLLLLLIIGWV